VSRYQKGKTNLDYTEARDSEWQRHQLGYMQVCTLLQTDDHDSTLPLSFLQAGCPSCRPTNSVKALKAPHLTSISALPCKTLNHKIACFTQMLCYCIARLQPATDLICSVLLLATHILMLLHDSKYYSQWNKALPGA